MREAEQYWMSIMTAHTYVGKSEQTKLIIETLGKYLPFASIFEFGCGTGRNLFYACQAYPEISNAIGLDVSPHMIRRGIKDHPGINLKLGNQDSNWFRNLQPGTFDIVFTVSALDHLPEPRMVIEKLLSAARKAIILLEPWCEFEGPVYPDLTETPYTYSWDYDYILHNLGVQYTRTDAPLKLTGRNVGKYYRLWEVPLD